ncbi:hypothetical protein SAMN05444349_11012 [Bacteroides faecichinchillae]|uniref:Uncharacterized protein n=1 Tax=Bacteroides faecichinchillae TaxID=871325 RepID=A0A1M4Y7U5_9BACE|nr:hypothetical protein SAMN05444349_11012 [Bacteroides faecichinchillae]
MSPNTTNTADVPKTTLLFTFPVIEQASKMTTPIKIKINPRFFNKSFMCVYLTVYYLVVYCQIDYYLMLDYIIVTN